MSSKLNKSEIIPGSFLSKFELKKRLNLLGIEPFIPNDNTFYLNEKSILINQYDTAIKEEQNFEKIKDILEKDKKIEFINLNNKRFPSKINLKNNYNNNNLMPKNLNNTFNNYNQSLTIYDENINNNNNKNNETYFSFNFNDFSDFPNKKNNNNYNINNNNYDSFYNSNIMNENIQQPKRKFYLKELFLIPFVGCVTGSIYIFSQYGKRTEIENLINRIDFKLIKQTFYNLFNISKNYTKIFTRKFIENLDTYFKFISNGINQILDKGILYNINLFIILLLVMFVFWNFFKYVFRKQINDNKIQLK